MNTEANDNKFKTFAETSFTKNWRPAMAWQYFAVCLFDFVGAPIYHSIIQGYFHQNIVQWTPLTLQGGGLYHLAMATVIGISAYGRTLEKINLANKGIISGGDAIGDSEIEMPNMFMPTVVAPLGGNTTNKI